MIRSMRVEDIEGAMLLKRAAGWNQTESDWLRLLRLEPEGCFVDERQGTVVGTTTAIRHARELAWIGMVLVLPDFRRQGVANGLMQHAMMWIWNHGIETTRLDATDMGRPLYNALGFRDEEPIERWERSPVSRTVRRITEKSPNALGESLAALDLCACGYDRSVLLRDLAHDPSVESVRSGSGFVFGRPGSEAWFIGPCVANSEAAAESLVDSLLAEHGHQHAYWDLLPDNSSACRLAARFGFRPTRRLMRMVHSASGGTAGRTRPDRVFATAGFEFG